jgi:hypothetical protein
MVGRALWSVRVLLDEDRPVAGSEDTSWTRRRGILRGKPSIRLLKPRHMRA